MTRCVAFRTPGLIPLESFTTFGVNVKPETKSPFGYFGTGLKYAIAVLLRNGCRIILWRDAQRYEFYVAKQDFRGREFAFVRMKKQNSLLSRISYTKLPFTTELGKNWELWQAFRELETNTRDENGVTSLIDVDVDHYSAHDPGTTYIYVFGDRFVDEYLDMDRHFLVDGKTVREDESVQVIDRPSSHVYYRGVRIMDLKQESEYTYNILRTVDLTEDRTAKYAFQVEQIIADQIVGSEDEVFVDRVSRTHRWEGSGLNFGYSYSAPSSTYRRIASSSSNPTAREYIKNHTVSVQTSVTLQISVGRPEVIENELMDVARVVAETLGTENIRVTNMLTQDVVDLSSEQSELV
jgi:hypothetical protein